MLKHLKRLLFIESWLTNKTAGSSVKSHSVFLKGILLMGNKRIQNKLLLFGKSISLKNKGHYK